MPTPAEIITGAAALMNDSAQRVYTNEAALPYLNIALRELQEIYEQNNLPITEAVSATITVPAGTESIGYTGGPPQLPYDLIDIQQVWERQSGVDPYIPMVRKDFLPHYLEGQQISQFLIWSWQQDAIKVLPANQDNDLKLDYTRFLFPLPIKIEAIGTVFPYRKIQTYLEFKTAALCARFVGENPTRADSLEIEAALAMDRALGIDIKSKQQITVRRRPFRSGFKSWSWW